MSQAATQAVAKPCSQATLGSLAVAMSDACLAWDKSATQAVAKPAGPTVAMSDACLERAKSATQAVAWATDYGRHFPATPVSQPGWWAPEGLLPKEQVLSCWNAAAYIQACEQGKFLIGQYK